MKFLLQATIAVRLFDGVEIFALEIFHQGELHSLMIAGVTHQDRHSAQAGAHGGAPTALAGDQLEAVVLGANDQRLNNALIANGRGEFFDLRFIESAARLKRARW